MEKKIALQLVGLNGNSFALLGAFQKQAEREGWNKEEISAVLKEATKGDYDHLLRVLMEHTEDPCQDNSY